MDNLEKLITAGKIAYGQNWQSPVSRALNISDRTIRNFVSQKSPAPIDLSERLVAAMESEIAKFQAAIDFVRSDIMNANDVTNEVISDIADEYFFSDEMARQHAIDAMNNAVFEKTYLSDLRAIASKMSR